MYQRRKDDPRLDELVAEYENLDRRIVDAEETTSTFISDEEMIAMKSERLDLKDQIMQRVQSSEAGN